MKREAAQGAQGCECENDLRGKVGCEKIITSGSDKGEVEGENRMDTRNSSKHRQPRRQIGQRDDRSRGSEGAEATFCLHCSD